MRSRIISSKLLIICKLRGIVLRVLCDIIRLSVFAKVRLNFLEIRFRKFVKNCPEDNICGKF